MTHLPRWCLVAPLLLSSACFHVDLDDLAKDPPTKLRYLFDVQYPERLVTPTAAQHPVLLVEQVHAQSPFHARPLVYRTGDSTYEADFYHEFLISPGEQLTQITRRWLRDAGVFPQLITPDSPLVADLLLSIDLVDLHGDFRDGQAPAAHLRLRASLTRQPRGAAGPEVLLQKYYAHAEALSGTGPDALVGGWNKAIAAVMGKLAADLRVCGERR